MLKWFARVHQRWANWFSPCYTSFFDHCTPAAMRKLFAANGLTDIRTRAFYRANFYFSFFFPAFLLVTLYENLCMALGLDMLASGFIITARKPAAPVAAATG
jgi:hypothetical protein